ncbi:MAG: hypothetical protein RIQ49_2673, partial [Pseudomonadota bacterium]
MKLTKRQLIASIACTAAAFSINSAQAQNKWDLASAYPAGNFHTKLLGEFAGEVDKGSQGKLKITVHSAASLFKA